MSVTILGVFSARRRDGHRLHDGNAAAMRLEGEVASPITAIGEERLTGQKHGDGFTRSARYCLESVGYQQSDRLIVGFSSSLDSPWPEVDVRTEVRTALGLHADEVLVNQHHDSHAVGAYVGSGFNRALVIVVDGEGNRLPDGIETTSVYLAQQDVRSGFSLRLLSREGTDGRGLGQLYRGATKYLGFASYHEANKVMALSGVGRSRGLDPIEPHTAGDLLMSGLDTSNILDSFTLSLGKVRPHLPPVRPGWFSDRRYGEELDLSNEYLQVAVTVQEIVEVRLRQLVMEWSARTGVTSVCLGGGVAMNCVAAAKLRGSGLRVFVPGAPSDEGQALGNLLTVLAHVSPDHLPTSISGYLGANGAVLSTSSAESLESDSLVNDLRAGLVVARHFGGSEYGPRALGHRSLLAVPKLNPQLLDSLRRIKRRERFQPFGVIVSDEQASKLDVDPSPYMSFAPVLTGRASDWFSDVSHVDGTCRIQTLTAEQDPSLYATLRTLEECGAAPVVNTSLNPRGKPLLETAAQTASLVRDSPDIAVAYVEGQRLLSTSLHP